MYGMLCMYECMRAFCVCLAVLMWFSWRQGTRLAALLPQDILETFRDKSTPGPRGKEVSKEAFDEGMQVGHQPTTETLSGILLYGCKIFLAEMLILMMLVWMFISIFFFM